jgi:hypothetical protein
LQDYEELSLPLPLLQAVWQGGGEGRPHPSLAIAGLDGNDNRNGNYLSKKRGWTREKERGNSKMGLFFHAVLFCYCFLTFLFQYRLIDFLSRLSQLLGGLLLQDFSFSAVKHSFCNSVRRNPDSKSSIFISTIPC